MLHGIARSIPAFALAAALGAAVLPAVAEPVTLNFVNAEIDAVAKAISQMTGRNFLLDPRVKGTINIVSSGPIPREEVYAVFLSALRLHGLAAVEARGVTNSAAAGVITTTTAAPSCRSQRTNSQVL